MKPEIIITSLAIIQEYDVVFARQRARQIAGLLKFNLHDQTRIATAVSEIARNVFVYAKKGKIEFCLSADLPQKLLICISDSGPGIPNLDQILAGQYHSTTGMGLGIIGTKRLIGNITIDTSPQGTTIQFGLPIPKTQPVDNQLIAEIVNELIKNAPIDPMAELRTQNQELIQALESIQLKQQELSQLNNELENTNRGVVALYAELDEKASELKRANSIKTRFLANMTHEFRTPLNSIISLCMLMRDQIDGQLSSEQEKQIQLIHKAAESLSELVNDLLDIAKVESGKIQLRPREFTVNEVFAVLRGLFLSSAFSNPGITLTFEEPKELPPLFTDEGKLSQILKNLISNALKFTEKGGVKVSAELLANDIVGFTVMDTGIGIADKDQERIFIEFEQIESYLQTKKKGTGLGLPLVMQLTKLLGGKIDLNSQLGKGSVFSVSIPRCYEGPKEGNYVNVHEPESKALEQISHLPLARRLMMPIKKAIIIDDEDAPRYILKSILMEITDLYVYEGLSGKDGIDKVYELKPDIIFLDLVMPDIHGSEILQQLKSNRDTAHIPVVLYSGKELNKNEEEQLCKLSGRLPKGSDKLTLINSLNDIFSELGFHFKSTE